jgi:predicted HTH domain antitoxin
MYVTISRTDLARNTREIVDQVRKGDTVVVQSYGEDQIVLLDHLDYKLLRALVDYALRAANTMQAQAADVDVSAVMRRYLDEQISLAKAAELLGVSRYELMEHFERLGIPLRVGPETLGEAQDEIAFAQHARTESE